MSLAGVLHGLRDAGLTIPVLGVQVGADPEKRLDKYAPKAWRQMVTIVKSSIDYHDPAPDQAFEGVKLDPIYEAKCIPHLQAGDLLWVVGIRATERVSDSAPCPDPVWHHGDSREIDQSFGGEADFVFSCPPYADLEVYSDDPKDLSTLEYDQFLEAYREIISKSCAKLANNRFACFVVGEVRSKSGAYYNFVGDTIRAFIDAGLSFYNEAILVTPVGNAAMRCAGMFEASRKMVKTHQNVLVFVKGDPRKATERCGKVDVSDAMNMQMLEAEKSDDE
jgi:hypothetical protein